MRKLFLWTAMMAVSVIAFAQGNPLQALADSLRASGNFPGLSIAIVVRNDSVIRISSGFNDKEKGIPLKPSDKFMQGSVGKTYVSAMALQLIRENKIKPDEKIAVYLGQYDWFNRIPNASSVTVRMLMNHTSGIMRYEFKERFTKDLTADPNKHWKPEELIQYILDEKASFAAGEGWEYSDTNYILLGMIIEKITGKKYYDLVKQKILQPFHLNDTHPTDQRKLKDLVQGYAGDKNEFGGKDKMIGEDGLFIINPQFEWTGGGIYSTTSDLAQWGQIVYSGKLIDTSILLSSPVAAKLGRDTKYALGVIIRPTALGLAYGHSGFFPGYQTELLYFPDKGTSIAVQTNSSDFRNLKLSLVRVAIEMMKKL